MTFYVKFRDRDTSLALWSRVLYREGVWYLRSIMAALNFNIGVLGHVDSGKTALGEALVAVSEMLQCYNGFSSKGIKYSGINSCF